MSAGERKPVHELGGVTWEVAGNQNTYNDLSILLGKADHFESHLVLGGDLCVPMLYSFTTGDFIIFAVVENSRFSCEQVSGFFGLFTRPKS